MTRLRDGVPSEISAISSRASSRPICSHRLIDAGQRRVGALGAGQIVKADHGDVRRHAAPGFAQCPQSAVAHQLAGHEQPVDVGPASEQLRRQLPTRLRGEVPEPDQVVAVLQAGFGQGSEIAVETVHAG